MSTGPSWNPRIALAGPAGSGKTTTAWLLQRLVPGMLVLSVAAPLREIEECVYRRLGMPPPSMTGAQDGQLLQALRTLILDRDPDLFERSFLTSIEAFARSRPVVNDDCRRALYPTLRTLGFTFVWVDGHHLASRRDRTAAQETSNPHDAVVPRELCERTIDNTGGLEQLVRQVSCLVVQLKAHR